MKREYRVRKHSEFDRIIKGGRKIKSPHFSFYFLQAAGEETHGYVGIAVSKANGKAVDRVREKRQVRAMLAKTDVFEKRIYLIIVIRPNYKMGAFHENEAELLECIQKIKEQQN